MTSARLAVDIGGTFTDFALEQGGRRFTAKTLTTPEAPELGVLTGVKAILQDAGLQSQDIALLVHGTTLATNAIIERKGAVTALVTTEGFRDVLAMGNESRYDQYDPQHPAAGAAGAALPSAPRAGAGGRAGSDAAAARRSGGAGADPHAAGGGGDVGRGGVPALVHQPGA